MKHQLVTCFALLASGALAAQEPLAFASGSWFNPERNGEGFVVQLIPDGAAIVTWFTYPPEEETGAQAWMIGVAATAGNRIVIAEMERPVGAVFGPEFDPETVVRQDWGSLEMEFEDCNSASVSWAGPPAFGSGSMDLIRLTSIDDVECNSTTVSDPDRVISGRSGAWYDPSHDGEGWMVETLDDGTMVVYWFTYDDQGRQAWFLGVAKIEGKTLWIDDVLTTRGAHFGAAFQAENVEFDAWGSFGFVFEDCEDAQMRYASTDARFGQGTLAPVRLAQLVETNCTEPPSVAPLTAGIWRQSTDMPSAVSESASVGAGGFVYSGGGTGNLSTFHRFDPNTGSHEAMPALPGLRHHSMMTSDGHDIYMAGGYSTLIGAVTARDNFWRFDPDADQWEILSSLPKSRAAGAAVYMHNRVWIVGGEGIGIEIQSYNINTGEWELFPGDFKILRDHMQAVVFENEIWSLGGRAETTYRQVLIWNPVSREWREGPPMIFARAGLAAKIDSGSSPE